MVKNPPTIQETWVGSLGQEDPLKKEMAIHSSILAGKFHGQRRSLAGSSPWGHKVSGTTQQTNTFTFLFRHAIKQTTKEIRLIDYCIFRLSCANMSSQAAQIQVILSWKST